MWVKSDDTTSDDHIPEIYKVILHDFESILTSYNKRIYSPTYISNVNKTSMLGQREVLFAVSYQIDDTYDDIMIAGAITDSVDTIWVYYKDKILCTPVLNYTSEFLKQILPNT